MIGLTNPILMVPELRFPEGAADADVAAAVVAADDGAAAAVVDAGVDAAGADFLLLEHAARSGLVNASVVAPRPAARKFRRLMAAWTASGCEEGSTMTSTIAGEWGET